MVKSILGLIMSFLIVTVPALAQVPEGLGEKYALIIGIKGYPGFPENERLKFADDDALLFKNFLQTPEGGSFQEQNIRLLLNENAKREDIYLKGLNWLKERVHRDDLVYVFFAGHGVEDPDDHSVYFMPFDGKKSAPEGMGIHSSNFLQYFKSKIDPRHLIVFIDACHAAAAATADGTARDGADASASLSANWKEVIKGQEAMNMAFFATSANERSWEDNELGHGVFTWFLIKGLKGEADRNKNNIVTAGELHLYLLENVPGHTAKKFRREQTPLPSQKFNPQFPLAVFNIGDWYEKGLSAFDNRNYREAIGYFTEAIRLNPQYQNAYIYRGVAKYNLGDKRGAIEDYSRAIELNPKDAVAYNNRGVAMSDLGDKQAAIADLNKSIELDPKSSAAYHSRGAAKSDLGDKQGAVADLSRAIELNPKVAMAYFRRGAAKYYLGDKQGAVADFSRGIELDPKSDNDLAYYLRGAARADLGDKQGAIGDYNRAIELDPKNAFAYYNRGIAKFDLGDKQGAIADLSRAIELNPKDTKAYFNRGVARYAIGDNQGAIADYSRAVELDPKNASTYYLRGAAKHSLGDKQGAIADWISAAKLGEERARKWLKENGYSWQ